METHFTSETNFHSVATDFIFLTDGNFVSHFSLKEANHDFHDSYGRIAPYNKWLCNPYSRPPKNCPFPIIFL